jgi:MFS family permease
MTWLPTYFVRGRGLELHQSALYTMMPYIVAIFTYPIGGYLADKASTRFGQNFGRKSIPVVGMITAGVLLIIGSKAPDATTAVIMISLSNGVLCLTMGGYYSMPMIFSHINAGKITGLWATFATAGGISSPILTGIIVDAYGYMQALYFGAIISIIGSVILGLTCRIEPILPDEKRSVAPEHGTART